MHVLFIKSFIAFKLAGDFCSFLYLVLFDFSSATASDRVFSYTLGSYQPHQTAYSYQPRLEPVLDYDEENTTGGTPNPEQAQSSGAASDEPRHGYNVATDGGASTAEDGGGYSSGGQVGKGVQLSGCGVGDSSGVIPASPHFSAVDYKMCDSDHNTQYEIEVLGKELTRLRVRLEKLSKRQKSAANKG